MGKKWVFFLTTFVKEGIRNQGAYGSMAESLGRKIYMILWLSLVMKNLTILAKGYNRHHSNFVRGLIL